jgi:hypothetical protein
MDNEVKNYTKLYMIDFVESGALYFVDNIEEAQFILQDMKDNDIKADLNLVNALLNEDKEIISFEVIEKIAKSYESGN